MADEVEVKVPDAPKASADESLIDNPRAAIEKQVITENETPEVVDTPTEETTVETEATEEDVLQSEETNQEQI